MPFIQGLAEAIGQPDWQVLPDTLVKMPAKLIENPRAGLTKPDGTKEPAQIAQDTGRWMVQFKTPEGVVRAIELTSPDITERGLKVGDPGIDPKLHGNWQPASEPRDVPQGAETPAEANARLATAEANANRAKSEADVAAANLKKVQEDTREREYNQQQGNGYLSHDELRKLNQDATELKLSQDQIALRRQEIENNNRNTARANEISALNAATAAANSETQARRELAQTRYEEGQLDLDHMKLEHQKAQDEINNRNVEAKIKLDQLTQQQANELAGRTLEQRQLEQAQNLQQRQAEAAQTAQTAAQTAATTAAANVYGTERQAQTAAGTVGANVLANRATAANNLIQNILGAAGQLSQPSAGRYGTLGGGLQTPLPAGFGAGLVSGAMGVSGEMFGGQDTLDAAARMVRGAAPGAELTPQGQAAIGVLQQAFERFGQLNGAPHPAVAATIAAKQTANSGAVTSPVTQPQAVGSPPTVTAGQLANRAAASAQTAAATQQAQGGFGAIGANPMAAAMQAQRQPQVFTAPQTQGAPVTVTINA